MRLDRFLANLGYGSRNEIKGLCRAGNVIVNNQVIVDSSLQINPELDQVVCNDTKIDYQASLTILINKPSGYICSNKDEKYPSLLKILPIKWQRMPLNFAGRLDYDTEGLVLASTDGQLIHRIISPKKLVDKTYYVVVKEKLLNEQRLLQPMSILDGKNAYYITKATKVVKNDDYSLYLTIHEGKYHQVKRMISYLGNEVVYLKRISIGGLVLPDNMESGEYQELSADEVAKIFI